ncbi:MAG: ATP-binding protein [Pseudomonadota bacterium]
MKAHFSMPVRVGLIVVIALFTGWLTLLAVVFISMNQGESLRLPSAERFASLASLVERLPTSERAALIDVFDGWQLTIMIANGPPVPEVSSEQNALDAATFAAIQDQLAPRKVIVSPQDQQRIPAGPLSGPIRAIEFQIALSTGETLIVMSRSPFVITAIGLPLGFAAALAGIFIALVTLIIIHREFRPLSALAVAVDQVDPAGDPIELPKVRARSPELHSLIDAFAGLQGRLKTLIRGRMALIGGIQHDVRTFATRLRLRVDKIDDPAERDRAITDISDMIHLLDDALLASRAGASELDEELIDLVDLVRSETTDRQDHAAAVSLSVAPSAFGLNVLGDRLALRRIIANLVENALRYGNAAHVSLSSDDKSFILIIDDEGPGIPPEQRALLLEPFTRVEGSRARKTGGSGLGLAVVRSLLSAHSGSLEIGDAPLGGARLTVSLPIFAVSSPTPDKSLSQQHWAKAPTP